VKASRAKKPIIGLRRRGRGRCECDEPPLHITSDNCILSGMNKTGLATVTSGAIAPFDADTVARAAARAVRPQASATARAYAADWSRFDGWCSAHGLAACPADPSTIALYLSTLADAGKRYATIARAYAAIRAQHSAQGSPLPTLPVVTDVLHNLARELGTAPKAKTPIMADQLRAIARAPSDSVLAVRDRALLLLGFAAALRRSELVALDVADVRSTPDGLEVTIRRSKTDQTGAGRLVGVPHGSKGACPVRALQAWLDVAGIADGPIFRAVSKGGRVLADRLSDRAVARTIQGAASAAGLEGDFGGHSLRAGLATSAAKAGKGESAIMAQTGHKSATMVRRYIRHASIFDANAAEGLL
jgi:integrase